MNNFVNSLDDSFLLSTVIKNRVQTPQIYLFILTLIHNDIWLLIAVSHSLNLSVFICITQIKNCFYVYMIFKTDTERKNAKNKIIHKSFEVTRIYYIQKTNDYELTERVKETHVLPLRQNNID